MLIFGCVLLLYTPIPAIASGDDNEEGTTVGHHQSATGGNIYGTASKSEDQRASKKTKKNHDPNHTKERGSGNHSKRSGHSRTKSTASSTDSHDVTSHHNTSSGKNKHNRGSPGRKSFGSGKTSHSTKETSVEKHRESITKVKRSLRRSKLITEPRRRRRKLRNRRAHHSVPTTLNVPRWPTLVTSLIRQTSKTCHCSAFPSLTHHHRLRNIIRRSSIGPRRGRSKALRSQPRRKRKRSRRSLPSRQCTRLSTLHWNTTHPGSASPRTITRIVSPPRRPAKNSTPSLAIQTGTGPTAAHRNTAKYPKTLRPQSFPVHQTRPAGRRPRQRGHRPLQRHGNPLQTRIQ